MLSRLRSGFLLGVETRHPTRPNERSDRWSLSPCPGVLSRRFQLGGFLPTRSKCPDVRKWFLGLKPLGGVPRRSARLYRELLQPHSSSTSPTMADSAQPSVDSTRSSPVSVDARPDKDTVEKRPQHVASVEYETLMELFKTIECVAPHMADSFILNKRWWNDNAFKHGIQVTWTVNLQGQHLHQSVCRCSSIFSCNLSKPPHTFSPSLTLRPRDRTFNDARWRSELTTRRPSRCGCKRT